MDDLLKELGGLAIRIAGEKLRARVVEALAHVVCLEPSSQTDHLLSLTERWFGVASSAAAQPLAPFLQQIALPFAELRASVYFLLRCLAQQPWGCQLLRDAPGATELLLNRENDRALAPEKWQVVRTIVEDSGGAGAKVFSRADWLRLAEHVRQGVFYVQAQTRVAVEDAN